MPIRISIARTFCLWIAVEWNCRWSIAHGDALSAQKAHSAVREDPPAPGERGYNVFRNLVLHGLKEEEDFKLVYTGLARLLANLHLSQSAYIPSSGTTVRYVERDIRRDEELVGLEGGNGFISLTVRPVKWCLDEQLWSYARSWPTRTTSVWNALCMQ